MQGDKIVQKILQDANEKSEKIIDDAKSKVKEIENQFKDYSKKENAKLLNNVKIEIMKLQDKYQVLENIESRKIYLLRKQEVLDELKKKAFEVLLSKTKKEKLRLIQRLLLNNAEKNQTLLVLFDGITLSDVKSLSIVKKLSLIVKKGSEQGLILIQDNFDKNLSLRNLIQESFEKNESQILSLLFG